MHWMVAWYEDKVNVQIVHTLLTHDAIAMLEDRGYRLVPGQGTWCIWGCR